MAKDIAEISKILEQYTTEVAESITNKAIEIGDECVKQLKSSNMPNRTGKYRKSWTKQVRQGSNFINVKVHNKKYYRLTHLLEKGHATRNGGRTKAIPHIAPVEKYAENEFEKSVEKIIKNGGN